MSLPQSWIEARLDTVAEINPRLGFEEQPENNCEVTFVPMSAVDEYTGTITTPETRKYIDVAKGYSSFKEQDVLFAKVTPCMENGKAAIADKLTNGLGFGSTEFHVIRPLNLVLPEYLLRFIRQPFFRKYAKSAFQGTGGLQRVPPGFLSRVKIPLPSIAEQKFIVDLLQQSEKLIELRFKSENLFDRIKRQLFIEMFGNPHPKANSKWSVVKLGSVVKVATGGTPSREQNDSYGGEIAWVKSMDLKDSAIEHTDETLTESGIKRSNAKVYPKDTVLLAMYGQGQTRGRTGKLLVEAACNQACAAFLPNEEFLPDYLWVWFQLSYEAVRALGRGGQQENLNLDIIRSIVIPKPPVELQEEFSRRLQHLLEIKKAAKVADEQLKTLFETIQLEAMTGAATELWREKNQAEINKAVQTRDAALAKLTPGKIKRIESIAPKSPSKKVTASNRHALLNELSEFQNNVRLALTEWPAKYIIPDDATALEGFCGQWPLEHEVNVQDRTCRALDQLASMGLIAKVTLPNEQGDYLLGYRELREDEARRGSDIAILKSTMKRLQEEA